MSFKNLGLQRNFFTNRMSYGFVTPPQDNSARATYYDTFRASSVMLDVQAGYNIAQRARGRNSVINQNAMKASVESFYATDRGFGKEMLSTLGSFANFIPGASNYTSAANSGKSLIDVLETNEYNARVNNAKVGAAIYARAAELKLTGKVLENYVQAQIAYAWNTGKLQYVYNDQIVASNGINLDNDRTNMQNSISPTNPNRSAADNKQALDFYNRIYLYESNPTKYRNFKPIEPLASSNSTNPQLASANQNNVDLASLTTTQKAALISTTLAEQRVQRQQSNNVDTGATVSPRVA
jgi:hypothetical protein